MVSTFGGTGRPKASTHDFREATIELISVSNNYVTLVLLYLLCLLCRYFPS